MNNLPFLPKDVTIKNFGNGLINMSWRVDFPSEETPSWLLQKINHNIFKDIEGLTGNILKVTRHIRSKLESMGETNIDRKVLTPVIINPTANTEVSKYYYRDTHGEYWRAFLFIENSYSYERMENPEMAKVAGQAFGKFHKLLSDFPGDTLCEVLPGFHYTPGRIENLKKRVEDDPVGRLKECKELADLLLSRAGEFSLIAQMGARGELPIRVVHQDTKINNVLFDSCNKEGIPTILCIVDLDTVMPGYICYDVGDAIRSGANTGAEDEKDLTKISMDLDIYKGFVEGFLEETKDFITQTEIATLPFGPKLLAYEQAVRFLDDYLAGDTYYKTMYKEHNLVRAKAQTRLLQTMDQLL